MPSIPIGWWSRLPSRRQPRFAGDFFSHDFFFRGSGINLAQDGAPASLFRMLQEFQSGIAVGEQNRLRDGS